jgi:polysaccharide pyruvyl transferase WcaK-like protein
VKRVKIFIAENIPSLNKGEETILDGMMESFKLVGDVTVTMLSGVPNIDAQNYGSRVRVLDFKIVDRDYAGNQLLASIRVLLRHLVFMALYLICHENVLRIMRGDLWKEYLNADVIIIGHDGTFGMGGHFACPFILYPIYIPYIMKAIGKKVVLYGGSINQLERYYSLKRYLYKLALKKIDLVTLREQYSFGFLEQLHVGHRRAYVTADLAYLMDVATQDSVDAILSKENIRAADLPLLGITVTREVACLAFRSMGEDESYRNHNLILAGVIDRLIEELGVTIVFLPHCIGYGDERDDRLIARDIYRECRNQGKIRLIENEYTARELKGLMCRCGMLVGERIHSVINAMSACVPVLTIARKIDNRRGIIEMVNKDYKIIYASNLSADILYDSIKDIWDNRDVLIADLRSRMPEIRENALRNGRYLKELATDAKE